MERASRMNVRSRLHALCSIVLVYLSAHVAAAPLGRRTTPKPSGEKTVTDADVRNLERHAMNGRSATDAVNLYNEFLAVKTLIAKQKDKVLDRKKVWQER